MCVCVCVCVCVIHILDFAPGIFFWSYQKA